MHDINFGVSLWPGIIMIMTLYIQYWVWIASANGDITQEGDNIDYWYRSSNTLSYTCTLSRYCNVNCLLSRCMIVSCEAMAMQEVETTG